MEKGTPWFVKLFLCLLFFPGLLLAESAQQHFPEGQRAYAAGDLEGAKAKFSLVIGLEPQHQQARNYLKMIAAAETKSGRSGVLEKQLSALIIPKVEFREATFGTALNYLRTLAEKESEGKVKVSFVVQMPAAFVETQTVTLNVTNIPFTEVLRYLGDLAGVQFVIERYAIIVKERTGKPL